MTNTHIHTQRWGQGAVIIASPGGGWLEEMFPKMRIDLGTDNKTINLFFDEWNIMRDKKQKMIINYEEYFEWKINYKVEEDSDE